MLFHVSKVRSDCLTITRSKHHRDCVIISYPLEVFASLCLTVVASPKQKVQISHIQSLSEADQACNAIIGPTVYIIEKFKMLTEILAECFNFPSDINAFLFQLRGNFSSRFGTEL